MEFNQASREKVLESGGLKDLVKPKAVKCALIDSHYHMIFALYCKLMNQILC